MKSSNKILAGIVLFLAGVGAYAIYDRTAQTPTERAAKDIGEAINSLEDEVDR